MDWIAAIFKRETKILSEAFNFYAEFCIYESNDSNCVCMHVCMYALMDRSVACVNFKCLRQLNCFT